MYIYFKIIDGDIRVVAVFYNDKIKLAQGHIDNIADVVWRVTPEGIEWMKDRWQEEFNDTGRKYGYAFIQDVTNGMSMFANALCMMLGLNPKLVSVSNGTTRLEYSEDTSHEG